MLFSDIVKKGYGAPSPSDLIEGGLGVDVSNKKVYSKATDSTIFQIGPTDAEMEAKVDVVMGKELSANDFTNTYKDKLDKALTIPDPAPTEDNIVIFDASGEAQDSEIAIIEIILIANLLDESTGEPDAGKPIKLNAGGKIDSTMIIPPVVVPTDCLIFKDIKSAGTDGGTFTSGAWRTRDLNTEQYNGIAGASLLGNQMTLPEGTYEIFADAPAVGVDTNQIKLYNITDSADTLIGSSGYANDNYPSQVKTTIIGIFIVLSEKIFEIQHKCSLSKSANGLGHTADLGVPEVYTQVRLRKIA